MVVVFVAVLPLRWMRVSLIWLVGFKCITTRVARCVAACLVGVGGGWIDRSYSIGRPTLVAWAYVAVVYVDVGWIS